MTRRASPPLLVVILAAFAAACAGADTSTQPQGDAATVEKVGTTGSDSSHTNPTGEWHLATIHGVILGAATTDTLHGTPTTPVASATVQVHAGDLVAGSSNGSAPLAFVDRGVVATLTSGPGGEIDYIVPNPIIVRSGEPTPLRTYRMTITPPAGSPFAARDVQVYFAEQAPAGAGRWKFYLWRTP